MRTTLDLPDDLIKGAKATSAMQGIPLKQYVAEALGAYMQNQAQGKRRSQKVSLPLVGTRKQEKTQLSNEDLEQALADSENIIPRG